MKTVGAWKKKKKPSKAKNKNRGSPRKAKNKDKKPSKGKTKESESDESSESDSAGSDSDPCDGNLGIDQLKGKWTEILAERRQVRRRRKGRYCSDKRNHAGGNAGADGEDGSPSSKKTRDKVAVTQRCMIAAGPHIGSAQPIGLLDGTMRVCALKEQPKTNRDARRNSNSQPPPPPSMSNIQMQFNKKSNNSTSPPPRSHTSMEMQAQRDLRMPSMPSAHSRDAHNRDAHNRDSANFARTYEKFYHDQQRATHDDHTCYVPLARSTLRPRTSLISRAFGENAPDIGTQVAAAMGAVATYVPSVAGGPHPSHYMQEQPMRNGGGYSQSCPLQQYVADRATHTSRHVGQRQRAIQHSKQSVISLLPDTVLSVRAKNNTFMGTMLRASPVMGVGLVPASLPQATMYQNHSIGRRSRSRVEL